MFSWLKGIFTGKITRKQQRGIIAAAASNRFTADWNVDIFSGDQIVYSDLPKLRSRARLEAKANPYARKYLLLCSQNIVGEGFKLQNKAKIGERLDNRANSIIEIEFKNWSKRGICTVDGRMTLRKLQEVAVLAVARDGEVFIRKIKTKENKYGFALQLIESDMLDVFHNEQLSNGRYIRMGIEFNEWHKPIAYHFWKKQPRYSEVWGAMPSGEKIRIPAEQIIHLYDFERSSESRGISWLAPVLYSLKMLNGYSEAAVINARVTASKMGFWVQQDGMGSPESYAGERDADGNYVDQVSPGLFEFAPDGYQLTTFDGKYPDAQYAPFVKAILRSVASGLGISYNSLSSDLEGVNYSSIRAGLLEERDNWKRLQQWFVDNALNEIFAEWLEMGLLTGAITLPYNKYDVYNNPMWAAKRWAWVDPQKDISAQILAINAGLKTRQDAIAETGNDLEDTFKQLALEQDLIEEYGININGTEKQNTNAGTDQESTEENADSNTDDQAGDEESQSGRADGRIIRIERNAI